MAAEVVKQATLVLFGGTGDLARRKLLPALFRLWRQRLLQDSIFVGVGRRSPDVHAYRALLREQVDVARQHPEQWADFEQMIHYHRGEINTREDFVSLRDQIVTLEQERQMSGRRLFYYSVGPDYFAPITEHLGAVGLIRRMTHRRDDPWYRIVVEKPFGYNLETARELDHRLHAVLDEHQIFRIDHYLGKETVQNVLAFRFANGLWEPTWNSKYIEHVQITVAESDGIGDRAGYYESAGAMRDMVQNHMMQLLALTAMEPPNSLDADSVRNEKLKVLQAIRLPQTPEEVAVSTVRGQYGPGTINGKPVHGYRDEPGVHPDSATPTYVASQIYLDTWRWANVPFLLRHGKRLPKKGTEIAIKYRTPPLALFRGTGVVGSCPNVLVLRIQPDEGVSLYFGAKRPGAGLSVSNVRMNFTYEQEFHAEIPEAYERLLLDAMLGDATLFIRGDEVRAMWRWADALIGGWDQLPPLAYPNYAAGTWGPPEAEALFPHGDAIPAGSCPVGWRRW